VCPGRVGSGWHCQRVTRLGLGPSWTAMEVSEGKVCICGSGSRSLFEGRGSEEEVIEII
jgi:hypothetical protein